MGDVVQQALEAALADVGTDAWLTMPQRDRTRAVYRQLRTIDATKIRISKAYRPLAAYQTSNEHFSVSGWFAGNRSLQGETTHKLIESSKFAISKVRNDRERMADMIVTSQVAIQHSASTLACSHSVGAGTRFNSASG
jgi:hypothetical protein